MGASLPKISKLLNYKPNGHKGMRESRNKEMSFSSFYQRSLSNRSSNLWVSQKIQKNRSVHFHGPDAALSIGRVPHKDMGEGLPLGWDTISRWLFPHLGNENSPRTLFPLCYSNFIPIQFYPSDFTPFHSFLLLWFFLSLPLVCSVFEAAVTSPTFKVRSVVFFIIDAQHIFT